MLAPLRWEGTFVPVLPGSLAAYVEAPTPYLMGSSRALIDAQRFDLSTVLVVDLDRCCLRRPAAAPIPPLPLDGLAFVEPICADLARRASATTRLRAPPGPAGAPQGRPRFRAAAHGGRPRR